TAHEAQRLTRVHAFDERDLFAPRFDEVRDLVQYRATLIASLGAPCGESLGGRRRRGVHVLLVARDHLADHLRIDRRHIIENLAARAPLRLAGDEVPERLLTE